MQTVAMRIGGRDAAAGDGRYYEKRNPFTGELVARVPDAGPLDAAAAAAAAAAAFVEWSKTPPSKRRAILWKAADLLEARAADVAKTITAETGATFGWGMFNTAFAASMMREAAAATTQITGEVIPSDIPGSIALSVRQPVGVVLGIAPWNAPMILGVRAVAMPLACGNTVVLKASEECPQTHRVIGDVLEEAGLPAGAINVLTTSREGAAATVDALIADPRVRRINFTGSTNVGRIIAEKAAKHLKPVLLELGGKAPLVVLDDADLDEAAAAANFGAFMHQGQICMSTERLVVQEPVVAAVRRQARRESQGSQGRRSGRAGHPDRLDGERARGAARAGLDQGRRRSRRARALRRRGAWHAAPADRAGPRHAADADLSRGVVRTGRDRRAGE